MKKILLIEDNETVRENTAELLALADYGVLTAENGEIGMERARTFLPDLVVCDIMMPKMDGFEVLRLMGKDPILAGTPFIFLTAKTDRGDMRTGMNLGADDYLTKPFEERELLDAIASRLEKHDGLKRKISRDLEGINAFLKEASEYIELEDLSRNYSLRPYAKKEVVFWEGDSSHALYFIESGNVKTYKGTESGKELVTGIFGPGDFIGQLSLLNSAGTYVENAVVLEDAELCAIPRADFIRLLYGNHIVSQKFICMISNNLVEMQAHLVDMAFSSVRKRAAKALLDLHGQGLILDRPNGGISIAREDFAGMIGTATETAIRTLSDFKDEGLITTDSGRRIIILNKGELIKAAQF
ncbi:response regulator [Pseudozobellia thermophila]|uniref:cAMP-binding domain of CRP or a regulatory subunit of cAMP-dependent protein kinases n=1 Tax=Pseudozobellia thermophila TaxID=192903 RepID=A0A1M6IK77_9FLAO|nr:response regulator [Pseudozobellia thermophila]SHJ34891.1 cAMP-binding domain of CRP or a regulatory subunit of cAMP-dependent protein kinases [Pseudozobellia thermophila]